MSTSSNADRVVIGMDPHKRSATIEVMTADETVLGGGRFGTDRDGYAEMRRYAGRWPDRVWAIEGCAGIGKHIAVRLLADGEEVVDVPPKLSARARVFATGQGRKTDATDAHSVALVGTRMAGLRPVVNDEQLAVLRLLVDRRRSLGEEHTRKTSQLHQLLLELIPGGAKRDLSAAQAKALLAKVRPRDVVGKTRRRVAAELVADLERIYARKKAANKELTELVEATGTTPAGPARHRTHRRRPAAGRGRRHHPLPEPRPTSRPGTAPRRSTPPPATRSGTGCRAQGTGRSTGSCTPWPASSSATPPRAATYYDRKKADGKAPDGSHALRQTPAVRHRLPDHAQRRDPHHQARRGRAREDNGATTLTPARPAHIPTPALRTSHFPDPPQPA